jgi:hypothetical protein
MDQADFQRDARLRTVPNLLAGLGPDTWDADHAA